MHEFLKSIGFKSYTTKKQIRSLVDWVLADPDHLSIISLEGDNNLSIAEREIPGGAGVTVVGEIDERGTFVPEYYFPQIRPFDVSSTADLSYRKETARDGYVGLVEDYRFGMALIFNVRNISDVRKNEMNGLDVQPYREVSFSALASDATIILPIYQPQMALKKGREDHDAHTKLVQDAQAGDQGAIERLAAEDLHRYQDILARLKDTDVYSMVESFMIPYGMESNQYYFLGEIKQFAVFLNPITEEEYYRMRIEVHGMPIMLAVNKSDVTGMPYEGARIRAHAWLIGDLS